MDELLKNFETTELSKKDIIRCFSYYIKDKKLLNLFVSEFKGGKKDMVIILSKLISSKDPNSLDIEKYDYSNASSVFVERQKEYFEYLESEIVVEEGALKCNKCKSSKIFTFSKQTRSADEPTTVFARCCECNAKWVL